jgi:hypothetical protein
MVIQLQALAVSFGESHPARDVTQGQPAAMDERPNELKMQSNGSHGMIKDHDGPKAMPQIGSNRIRGDQNAPHGCPSGVATQEHVQTKLEPLPREDRGKIVCSHAADVVQVD